MNTGSQPKQDTKLNESGNGSAEDVSETNYIEEIEKELQRGEEIIAKQRDYTSQVSQLESIDESIIEKSEESKLKENGNDSFTHFQSAQERITPFQAQVQRQVLGHQKSKFVKKSSIHRRAQTRNWNGGLSPEQQQIQAENTFQETAKTSMRQNRFDEPYSTNLGPKSGAIITIDRVDSNKKLLVAEDSETVYQDKSSHVDETQLESDQAHSMHMRPHIKVRSPARRSEKRNSAYKTTKSPDRSFLQRSSSDQSFKESAKKMMHLRTLYAQKSVFRPGMPRKKSEERAFQEQTSKFYNQLKAELEKSKRQGNRGISQQRQIQQLITKVLRDNSQLKRTSSDEQLLKQNRDMHNVTFTPATPAEQYGNESQFKNEQAVSVQSEIEQETPHYAQSAQLQREMEDSQKHQDETFGEVDQSPWLTLDQRDDAGKSKISDSMTGRDTETPSELAVHTLIQGGKTGMKPPILSPSALQAIEKQKIEAKFKRKSEFHKYKTQKHTPHDSMDLSIEKEADGGGPLLKHSTMNLVGFDKIEEDPKIKVVEDLRNLIISKRQAQKEKVLSVSELLEDKNFKAPSNADRTDFTNKFIQNLSASPDIAYFTGKKVPFAKSQRSRQCIISPFRQDGSIITVSAVGSLLTSNTSIQDSQLAYAQDKFLRKMDYHEKNAQTLTIKTQISTVDLFLANESSSTDSKLITYGELELKDDNNSENWDYAIVQFWSHESASNESKALKRITIPKALARVVNKEKNLHQVLFKAEHPEIKLFCFSASSSFDQHLFLNILTEPKGVRISKRHKLEGGASPYASDKKQEGLQQIPIKAKSLLQKQIWAYLANKELIEDAQQTKSVIPQAAPTIINIAGKTYLVMTLTIEEKSISLCFFRATNESASECGDLVYEIPGAEMFLGTDETNQNVLFLTNGKLLNSSENEEDPREARFSSPPLVKRISIQEMQKLVEIQASQKQKTQRVQQLLRKLATWEVKGDQQSMDLFRVFSSDFPYVECKLHDSNSRLTMLFNGREALNSFAVSFSLVVEGQADAMSAGRKSVTGNMFDKNTQSFEGWFLKNNRKVPMEITAKFGRESALQIEIFADDSSGKRYKTSHNFKSKGWIRVDAQSQTSSMPVQITQVDFDQASHEVTEMLGSLNDEGKTQLRFRPIDTEKHQDYTDCYPDEKAFSLVSEPVNIKEKSQVSARDQTTVTLIGYSKRSPLNARIYLLIKEEKVDKEGQLKTMTHKVILQKYDVIEFSLRHAVNPNGPSLDFSADVENGVIKDRNILMLEQAFHFSHFSATIQNVHVLDTTQRGDVFLLAGSIMDNQQNSLSKKNFISLVQVSEPVEEDSSQSSSRSKGFNKTRVVDILVPATEISSIIRKGGPADNEDGLIYCLKSDERGTSLQLVTVGYEFRGGAPKVNIFKFNLLSLETVYHEHLEPSNRIQETQHIISDFPIIAFQDQQKSNQIIMHNLTHKAQPQRILQLFNWKFVCFVDHCRLRDLKGVNRLESNILFIAQHEKQDKARLFTIQIDPFDAQGEKFGKVKAFLTVDFKLPNVPLEEFRKAELLFCQEAQELEDKFEDIQGENKLEMVLIVQYEEELWSVALTQEGVPNQKLLPDSDYQMMKRHVIRSQSHQDCVFVNSYNAESLNYRLMRVSVNMEKPGYCKQDLVYELSGYQIIVAIADPEREGFIYVLTEEQKLLHLTSKSDGKWITSSTYDLSMHKFERLLQNFSAHLPWESMSIDNRSLTILNRTYSTNTNFSFSITAINESKRQNKKNLSKTAANRAERLLNIYPMRGVLMSLQMWMADEFFFFRVRPLPGTAIIETMGQNRLNRDCEMHFANDSEVLINIRGDRVLAFDKNGYFVDKLTSVDQIFSPYNNPMKVLHTSAFMNGVKFLAILDKKTDEIMIVKEEQKFSGVPEVFETPFKLEDVEHDLKQLDYSGLEKLLNLKDVNQLSNLKKVAQTIKVHENQMLMTEYGTLIVVASCVFPHVEDRLSIFENFEEKEVGQNDFKLEKTQRLFGSHNFGKVQVLMVVCRSTVEQSQLAPLHDHQIRDETQENIKNFEFDEQDAAVTGKNRLNFQFAKVSHKILWLNYQQKCIWTLDASNMSLSNAPLIRPAENQNSQSFQRKQIEWKLFDCQSFRAKPIFQDLSVEQFEDNKLRVNDLTEESFIRYKNIPEAGESQSLLFQITVEKTAIILSLSEKKVQTVDTFRSYFSISSSSQEFQNPNQLAQSGFVLNTDKCQMVHNTDRSLGFRSPFADSKTATGLYRAYAEIDYQQLLKLQKVMSSDDSTKEAIGDIEPLSAICFYHTESFFSIFAGQGSIYELVLETVRGLDQELERYLIREEDRALFRHQLQFVLTRPTPVYSSGKSNEPVTHMSVLKQCLLFHSYKSRMRLYRMADFFDTIITDYISCTNDLHHVIRLLPSAQYMKMVDKFSENAFTAQLTESVMPKGQNFVTFAEDSLLITREHSAFGLSRYVTANESLRRVQVQAVPLNWVYANKGALSSLFRQFRINQEKYQGTRLLEIMFDAFWSGFKWKIFWLCFIPDFIYFMIAFVYIMSMLFTPDEKAPSYQLNKSDLDYMAENEMSLRLVFILMMAFNVILDVRQVIRNGIRFYLKANQSWVKIVSLALNIFILVYRQNVVNQEPSQIFFLRQIGAIAVLILWARTMFWLRLFDATAQYVSLISRTLKDIASFIIILVTALFALGTSLYLLQCNRIYSEVKEEDLLLPFNSDDNLLYSSLFYQYYIALGDFGDINLAEDSTFGQLLATTLFIITTFLSQITILNMLIAIMGDTFGRHVDEKDIKSKHQKLLLLSEYIDLIEFYLRTCCRCMKTRDPAYVYVVLRSVGGEGDDEDDIDEFLRIRKTIERKANSLETLVTKQVVKGMENFGANTKTRFKGLNEQIDNAQKLSINLKNEISSDVNNIVTEQTQFNNSVAETLKTIQERLDQQSKLLVEQSRNFTELKKSLNASGVIRINK